MKKKALIYIATTLLAFTAALRSYGDQVQVAHDDQDISHGRVQKTSPEYIKAMQEVMGLIGFLGGKGATQEIVISDTQLKKLEDQFYLFIDQKNIIGAQATIDLARAYQAPEAKVADFVRVFREKFH